MTNFLIPGILHVILHYIVICKQYTTTFHNKIYNPHQAHSFIVVISSVIYLLDQCSWSMFMINVRDLCSWSMFVICVHDQCSWSVFMINISDLCLWSMFVSSREEFHQRHHNTVGNWAGVFQTLPTSWIPQSAPHLLPQACVQHTSMCPLQLTYQRCIEQNNF